jgi:hypothetical protein
MSTRLEVMGNCLLAGDTPSCFPDGQDEMHRPNQMKCHELRDQITRNAYEVDPQRIATAVIVKLAMYGESRSHSWRGDPSPRAAARHPDRQAI